MTTDMFYKLTSKEGLSGDAKENADTLQGQAVDNTIVPVGDPEVWTKEDATRSYYRGMEGAMESGALGSVRPQSEKKADYEAQGEKAIVDSEARTSEAETWTRDDAMTAGGQAYLDSLKKGGVVSDDGTKMVNADGTVTPITNGKKVSEGVTIDDYEDTEVATIIDDSEVDNGVGVEDGNGDLAYGEFEYDSSTYTGYDRTIFTEDASAITAPMTELLEANAELQKQGIEDIKSQRKLEFDFLNKKQMIQLQQMQSKQNIPEAMRGQQFNQLMLNQFVEMSDIYTSLDLQKLNVDNELAQFKVAMEQQNFELANQMYDQALQRASITYDITGEYIPPELDYMYSQLDYAESVMSSGEPGTPEYDQAQGIFDSITEQIGNLGLNPDDRGGYKARKDAYAEWVNGFDMYLQEMPVRYQQYEIASQADTRNALLELKTLGAWAGDDSFSLAQFYDVIAKYPYANVEMLWGSNIDWEALGMPSPTEETVTENLRSQFLGGVN